ncbi:MAG TPA: oligosaccharide flippase family protein [Chloroflexota bacterium]|nr:oligosaccharide flippase family protein [Chloroflexota bacterium]
MVWLLRVRRNVLTRIDPVTRGWAVVTSAGVIRLGLGLVASLVIARALGPADFGIYAVLAATVAVVGGLAEGGLTEAAVLRISGVDEQAAIERGRAFFWLRLGLAAAVVAVGCAAAGPIAERLLTVDQGLLRWALLGIVATAASGAVSAVLQAIMAWQRMSSLTLVNTGLTAALALGLALLGRLDLLAALVVLGIGTSLVTFAVGRGMLPAGWSLRPPPLATLRAEAAHLVRTGRWLWVASVFAMLTSNAEVLLLNRQAALPLVGAYALALNLATKADLVNSSLYTVLLPGVAGLRDRAAVAGYVRRGFLRGGLIGLGLLLLIPIAEPLIVLIYGADFAPAVFFFRLLLGVMIFDVLLTPVLLLPLAYRQARLLAAADVLRALTLVLVALGLIPVYGAIGAIVARFAARVAGAVLVIAVLSLGRPALEVQHEEAPGVSQ